MRTILLAHSLSLLVTATSWAAIPVADGVAVTQREQLHAQEMAKLKEISDTQRDQLVTLNKQFDQLVRLNAAVGNPALVTPLPGIGALSTRTGVSATAPSGNVTVNVSLALGDSGGGIFTVMSDRFNTLDGTVVARDVQNYRPLAAVVAERANHAKVSNEVKQQRETLLEASRQIAEQLQTAPTVVDMLRFQGALAVLHLQLDATDRDLQFAAQNLQVQAIANENNRQRQALARQEEQAAEIRLALKRMAEGLRINTQPVPLRKFSQ